MASTMSGDEVSLRGGEGCDDSSFDSSTAFLKLSSNSRSLCELMSFSSSESSMTMTSALALALRVA